MPYPGSDDDAEMYSVAPRSYIGHAFKPKESIALRLALTPKIGRPLRDKMIGEEDIMNLKIALETSTSIEDFLKCV